MSSKANKSLPFEYQVRKSVRAQKTRIVVTADKVEVVIPKYSSVKNARIFVDENQAWISKTLNKLRAKQQCHLLLPKRYLEGTLIPYLGHQWPLILVATKLKRVKIEFNNHFKVHVPVLLASDELESAIRQALIKWMKMSARNQVEIMVTKYQEKHQLKPKSIRIKSQKSRWGSCGIHDDININWALILAAPEILEYVVVHELCHIRHRNHSANFWALVAEYLPDYKQYRRWLRENGSVLMQGL
jgi:predicted metal-dependent hydrolase